MVNSLIQVYVVIIPHYFSLKQFDRCIREGIEPMVSGVDVLRSVAIASDMLESNRQGRAVRIRYLVLVKEWLGSGRLAPAAL